MAGQARATAILKKSRNYFELKLHAKHATKRRHLNAHASASPLISARPLFRHRCPGDRCLVVVLLHHALAIRATGFRGHFALDDPSAAGAEAKRGDDGKDEAEQFHGYELCPSAPTECKRQKWQALKSAITNHS
jgi:hypothetical protein